MSWIQPRSSTLNPVLSPVKASATPYPALPLVP